MRIVPGIPRYRPIQTAFATCSNVSTSNAAPKSANKAKQKGTTSRPSRLSDRPGVIGTVGTLLGTAAINIADMDVGRAATPGTAVMLIATTAVVPDDVMFDLRSAPGIISAVQLRG